MTNSIITINKLSIKENPQILKLWISLLYFYFEKKREFLFLLRKKKMEFKILKFVNFLSLSEFIAISC